MPAVPQTPRVKLRATSRRVPRTRAVAGEAYVEGEAEPNMRLSRALLVMLLLHVVAVGGILAFSLIKERASDKKGGSGDTANALEAEESMVPTTKPLVKPGALPAAPRTLVHVVQPGETWLRIANDNGVTVDALVAANGATAAMSSLRPGQSLKLPEKSPEPVNPAMDHLLAPERANSVSRSAPAATPPAAAPSKATRAVADSGKIYTVGKGESPYVIAQKLKVNYDSLIKLNHIDDPKKLKPGQKLRIPTPAGKSKEGLTEKAIIVSRNSAYVLVICVAALVTVGLVMLYSTSAFARDAHGDTYFFLKRQGAWLAIGLVACAAATFIDYHFWAKIWLPLFVAAAVLLALCFVHPIGLKLNGSYRWVKFGPLMFQPSEVAKLAAIVALARWYTRYEQRSSQFLRGFILPMMLIGILMLLIVRETDLGTTLLIGGTMVAIMFVAGSNPLYMTLMAVGGLTGVFIIATRIHERLARLVAFADLEGHKSDAGWQQWWALIAFGTGGINGVGLGESRAKHLYLPYAHTDFIFPIIGEELGLRVTLLVVAAFLLITLSGIAIAVQARDRFGMLLGFGLVINIALQACVNIGMTTALLPNKGMPLPFISSGGSNLCLCLFFVGVLLNIYRQGVPADASRVAHAARLRARHTPRV